MDTYNSQNKVVNSNDNHQSSWLHKGDLAFNELCVPYISLADWLIAKHCKRWWKNHPELWDYQRAQFGICATLMYPQDSKEWTLRFIAIDLDCNPLELINDQETLGQIPELTPEHGTVADKVINIREHGNQSEQSR